MQTGHGLLRCRRGDVSALWPSPLRTPFAALLCYGRGSPVNGSSWKSSIQSEPTRYESLSTCNRRQIIGRDCNFAATLYLSLRVTPPPLYRVENVLVGYSLPLMAAGQRQPYPQTILQGKKRGLEI